MNVAIISDAHIPPKYSPSLFAHSESSFVNFLDFLSSNFNYVVLNGDIFESFSGTLPFAEMNYISALKRFPLIHKAIQKHNIIYIAGNNDMAALKYMNGKLSHVLNTPVPILFFHGHDVRVSNLINNFKTYCGAFAGRLGCHESWQMWWQKNNIQDSINQDNFVYTNAKNMSCSMVVSSHTHLSKIQSNHDCSIRYINPGSCMTTLSYASINFPHLFDPPIVQLNQY